MATRPAAAIEALNTESKLTLLKSCIALASIFNETENDIRITHVLAIPLSIFLRILMEATSMTQAAATAVIPTAISPKSKSENE